MGDILFRDGSMGLTSLPPNVPRPMNRTSTVPLRESDFNSSSSALREILGVLKLKYLITTEKSSKVNIIFVFEY